MDYKEINGDLFKLPENYYLCHCISSDFKLGLGIAAEFDKRFDMRKKLFHKYQANIFKPCALLVDNVFNLVTKEINMDFSISQLVKIIIVFITSVIAVILFDHGEET